MILVEGAKIKLQGSGKELAVEFAQLYHAMDIRMPDVISAALDIIENTSDKSYRLEVIKDESSIK